MPLVRSPQAVGSLVTRNAVEPVPDEGGLTQRMVLNILEAFFQRPVVLLIPLFLMLAVGIFAASNSDKEYRSTGVLNSTSGDLLADLTDTQTAFTFETPAAITSRSLSALIQTDRFISDVI